MKEPPVHLFVMGRNEWRSATDWPLPETKFTKYYLHGGSEPETAHGLLSLMMPGDQSPDRYVYDPEDPTPSAAFANGHIDGPRDISESAKRSDVLVYETPELTEEVEMIGPITAKLYASTSAHDTDWMVRLSDVLPDGRALFLGEGIMRARYRDPQQDGIFNPAMLSEIEPDRVYPYTIEFWRPTGNLFARGHRIRIEISSSYYPFYLRNPNSSEDNIGMVKEFKKARQAIYHDRERPSHVVFPVIPAPPRN